MRSVLESDTMFYYAVGILTILVFLVSVVAVAVLSPVGLGRTTLFGLVVGFGLFMLVFFISIAIQRIEDYEDV